MLCSRLAPRVHKTSSSKESSADFPMVLEEVGSFVFISASNFQSGRLQNLFKFQQSYGGTKV